MLHLLITGASGFIGRNLAGQLQRRYEVTAPGRRELDLEDDAAVRDFLKAQRFDVVIHCATVRSNRMTGTPAGLLRENCRMFFHLARNSAQFGKMICLGSGAEYDRRYYQPRMTEDYFDTHVPIDEYGFSKYLCAKAVSSYPNIHELRLFAVFGPYESWEVRFLSNACCRAVWDLPIVIRQNVSFDFLDVRDFCCLVEWFIEHTPRMKHYNVCSGKAPDLKSLAEKVVAVSGKNLEIQVKSQGLGREYSGDNTRLLEEIGGFRFRPMEESIRDLYHWYLERKDIIDPDRLHFDASETKEDDTVPKD
jgi:UDP-glucose 4-epimerase